MKRPSENGESLPQSKKHCKAGQLSTGGAYDRMRGAVVQEGEPIQHQAAPFLLATARLPLDALTTTWKDGQNRRVNQQHVADLCQSFQNGALSRSIEENYLLVSCSLQALRNMQDYIESTRQHERSPDVIDVQTARFDDWLKVNDEKLEVMAGQHRIAALRDYVARTGCSKSELWWTCKIYDRDALPPKLSIQLRVNRRDLSLPDSHGQIWMQLVAASKEDERLFEGKKLDVERRILDVLCLTGTPKFPVSRLVTLWNNKRWRSMITRWCETAVGKGSFNLSTWEWMASKRIDDYWFSTFDSVLARLGELPGKATQDVQVQDWKRLASVLPMDRDDVQAAAIRQMFYPYKVDPRAQRIASTERRRAGFLTALDDTGYHAFYEFLIEKPNFSFPNVHKLLETSKEEGQTMMEVMIHVVLWIDRESKVISDKRKSNKLLLRDGFVPQLRRGNDEKAEERAVKQSIQLEREVLDFLRRRWGELQQPATRSYLAQLPDSNDRDGVEYAKRFVDKFWKDLLYVVKVFIGPRFRPWWMIVEEQESGTDPGSDNAGKCSAMTRALCAFTHRIPEVADNPALNSDEASADLATAIDQAVIQWVLERCQKTLEGDGDPTKELISETARRLIESTRQKYSGLARSLPHGRKDQPDPADDQPSAPSLRTPTTPPGLAESIDDVDDPGANPPAYRKGKGLDGISDEPIRIRGDENTDERQKQYVDDGRDPAGLSLDTESTSRRHVQPKDGDTREPMAISRQQQQPQTMPKESSNAVTKPPRPRISLPSGRDDDPVRLAPLRRRAGWRNRPAATSST